MGDSLTCRGSFVGAFLFVAVSLSVSTVLSVLQTLVCVLGKRATEVTGNLTPPDSSRALFSVRPLHACILTEHAPSGLLSFVSFSLFAGSPYPHELELKPTERQADKAAFIIS